MRILFIGDIVGRSGRNILLDRLPRLIADWKLDLVVVNGENAAGGFGITEAIYNDFIDAGADAITLGNHAWDQREALVFIERAPRLIRPLNYPPGTPGRGAAMIDTKNGARALVINAMGRIFMDPLDDPFAAVERELAACALKRGADAIVVDMHCEATSEKQAMGYFADGRASLVVGTHTHVPTADHRILPGGTAFMSDVGMTGDYDSVIGMDKDEPLSRFLRQIPQASSSRRTARRRCARSRSRPTTRPGLPRGRRRCGSAASWKRRGRRSGADAIPSWREPPPPRHGRACPTDVRHGLCLMECTALILLGSSWLRIIWTREGIKAVQHQNIVFHALLKQIPWSVVDRLVEEHGADRRSSPR